MKRIILFLLLHINFSCFSQQAEIAKISKQIHSGKFIGLKKLSKYLDSEKILIEKVHNYTFERKEKSAAIEILRENSLFLPDELIIDSNLNATKFNLFLKENSRKITYCQLSNSFLITPLSDRKVDYQLKKLAKKELESLRDNQYYFENYFWISITVKKLIVENNPECLKSIAAYLYKNRNLNSYIFDEDESIELLKKLTNIDLAIPNVEGKINYILDYNNFDDAAKLNHLNYWVNHFKDYEWNSSLNMFVNKIKKASEPSIESLLIEKLTSGNDSTAIDAFTKLSTGDTLEVIKLSEQYENNIIYNRSLPIFAFEFLPQMARLVQYCRDNEVDFQISIELKKILLKLQNNTLTFVQRYDLENEIIDFAKLADITPIEYWGLIHENEFESTYSIGRILDILYSKYWNEIVTSKSELSLYLKKSFLFDRLGIIGICNNYLKKFKYFQNASILSEIKEETNDKNIINQINFILKNYPDFSKTIISRYNESPDFDMKDTLIANFEEVFNQTVLSNDEYEIQKIISKIDYSQIGLCLNLLKKISWIQNGCKYSFLESNFGFPINANDSVEVSRFQKNYEKFSEYDLCKFYLLENGYNIFLGNDKLDYNRIYEILTFDIVNAFVGGGGGAKYYCIYLIIKILEIKHGTTLNFEKKFCQCTCATSLSPEDQAKTWINFLFDNNLITSKNKAVSFSD